MSALTWRNISARPVWILLSAGLASIGPGCAKALPMGFDQEAPDGRIQSIVQAARSGDTANIPDLIALLDSDDPAVRMFSIRTLERLTGQTLGYDHAGAIVARESAIERWVVWYESSDDAGMDGSSGADR